MKKLGVQGLAALACVSLLGCYHVRVQSAALPDPDTVQSSVRVDAFLWGLVAPARIDSASLPGDACRNGINQTVERVRWWHATLTVATVGLYTPYDLIVECAR